jgi:hypothetical protein
MILKLNEEQQGYTLVEFGGGLTVVNSDEGTIFATPNLNLEDVPVIESVVDVKANKAADKESLFGEYYLSAEDRKNYIKGYKQAQQNLFTGEDIKKAIAYGINRIIHNKGIPSKEESDGFIQSLKQPKVEITFENEKPVKCVLC